jgi:hypothetical protein
VVLDQQPLLQIDEINDGSKTIFAGGFTYLTVEMVSTVGSKHKPSKTVFLQ